MNWEAVNAIAEMLSAIAVLATLIYLAVQIRSMQSSSLAESAARQEEGDRELRKLCIEHSDLMLSANRGDVLNEQARYVLGHIYGAFQAHYFTGYLRGTAVGREGGIYARNFARALAENPALIPLYREKNLIESPSVQMREFAEKTEAFLSNRIT